MKDQIFEIPASDNKPTYLLVTGGKGASDRFSLEEAQLIKTGKANRQLKKRWQRVLKAQTAPSRYQGMNQDINTGYKR